MSHSSRSISADAETPASLADNLAPRKLSHEQARTEQRLYWAGKSVAERLAAATALTERLYRMRGIDLDDYKTDFTPNRVRRRPR